MQLKKTEYDFSNALKNPEHALVIEFFTNQERDLFARIKNESKSNTRKMLENSLSEVRKQLTSLAF